MKRRLAAGLALLLLVAPVLFIQSVKAAPGLPNRSLFLNDSDISATTTYDFQFDLSLAGNMGSIQFEFCIEDPLPFETCTAPSGFDISGSSIGGQTGETGFSIHGSTTANSLVLTRASVAVTPQTVTYSFDDVVNPDTGPATYYVRIYTFASTDASGPSVEEGGIAFAVTDDFDVSAFVPPFLEFCVGITITAHNCATATGDSVDFGVLDTNSTQFDTSQMTAATNGVGGVAISIIGTTMTSGIHIIDPLSSPGTSQTGTNQFGLNLRDNSSPNIGTNPTGLGTIVPTGNYNLLNQFTFNTGDQIAVSAISTRFNTLTASYVVNIDENQDPGVYTSTITYVATATF